MTIGKAPAAQSWDEHMETNLRAPFAAVAAFRPAGARRRHGRHRQHHRPAGAEADAAIHLLQPQSKAGLYWLTTTLAQALGPRIRVNAVGPGPTMRNARQSEADFARQRDATILKRGAEPHDMCAAVRYLLEAEAVTGQMLAVDGGQHLIWQTPDVRVSE